MPRPRSLTDAAIAAAALDVLDRAGIEGLTMRAVAGRLRMGTMSLYRYVPDRHALERLVVDQVLGAVDLAPPPDPDWRRRLTVLVERTRAAVRAHLAVVPLLVAHRHTAPGVMRCAEAVLGVLAGAGLDGERRVVAFRAVIAYLIGALENEYRGPLAGPGTAVLAALPMDRYPNLAEAARYAAGVGPDEEFGGGLALLLSGISGTSPGDLSA